jgi:hypothetical protein
MISDITFFGEENKKTEVGFLSAPQVILKRPQKTDGGTLYCGHRSEAAVCCYKTSLGRAIAAG